MVGRASAVNLKAGNVVLVDLLYCKGSCYWWSIHLFPQYREYFFRSEYIICTQSKVSTLTQLQWRCGGLIYLTVPQFSLRLATFVATVATTVTPTVVPTVVSCKADTGVQVYMCGSVCVAGVCWTPLFVYIHVGILELTAYTHIAISP